MIRRGELLQLSWCENVWCGEVYDVEDGWAGRCPSCLALADEHLAGIHAGFVRACAECRRESPRTTVDSARSA